MSKNIYFNGWFISFYILFSISLYLFFAPFEGDSNLFPHFDKLVHFLIFFLMTTLLAFGGLNKYYALIFCIFYALLTEIIQNSLSYRNGSIFDLVSDIFGITFAIFFIFSLEKRVFEHK